MMKALLFTEDNYESMIESTKSCMALKKPDYALYNICTLTPKNDSVI